MMFDVGLDRVGAIGTQWYDDDDAGRLVIEIDGREVARVTPLEAAAVHLMLSEVLERQGFKSGDVEKFDMNDSGPAQ